MSGGQGALDPGLYLVPTPIGTANDITLRALDVLGRADLLAAEDTRVLRKLMEIHGIARNGRPIWAYHDKNGAKVRPEIVRAIADGKAVAYASDAGTPLIADPGFQLAEALRDAGLRVHALPGPSAVLVALQISGLPTDRFLFAGFAPPQTAAREKFLNEFKDVPATLVFFEAPHRCYEMIRSCVKCFGEERKAALCRELTKKFEEIKQGTLQDILDAIEAKPPKGECVIVVDRSRAVAGAASLDAALRVALASQSVKDAAADVAAALGLPKRQVYQAALALVAEDKG